MYSIKNIVALSVLLTLTPVTNAEPAQELELQQMLKEVPEKKLDRERELDELSHVKEKITLLEAIEQKRSSINDLKNGKTKEKPASNRVEGLQLIERQIQQQLSLVKPEGKVTKASPENSQIKDKSVFSAEVELLSLWGDVNNPKADVIINSRQAEIQKGTLVQGWEVKKLTPQYMDVQRGNKKNRVFFSR